MIRRTVARTAALVALLIVAAALIACGSSPVASSPAQPKAPTVISYAINVPDLAVAQTLRGQYPNGIALAPVTAQQRFDYTATYGYPNVYYGSIEPPPGRYLTGVVVAPISAASKPTFTAADWPTLFTDPTATYSWLGYFEFTVAAR